MGRRSRKRTLEGRPHRAPEPAVAGAEVHARTPDRRARRAEAPAAPWAPFPLVEVCVLIGMVLILVGFFWASAHRGPLLVAGFALVSMAALELAVREHAAGYRSHTTMLSGCVAIVAVVPLFLLTRLPQEVLLILGAAVFAVAFGALRTVFARTTGGLGFRA